MPKKKLKRTRSPYKPAGQSKPLVDPEIRAIANHISRLTPKELSEASWISRSCAYNLLNGKTKKPQNLTIAGLLHAAGYTRKIVKL